MSPAAYAIILVSWNTREKLRNCLLSIERHASEAELIVIDNGSSDGSREMIRAHFPGVTLVANKENRGFARANNQGARLASRPYLCFLNSDTEVPENSLSLLVDYLQEHPGAGAVGPRIQGPGGKVEFSYGRFPNLWTELYLYLVGIIRHVPNPITRWRRMGGRPRERTTRVDWVSGCCLVTPREVFAQVGGWDERYFMYYEDAALCRSIRRTGRDIVYVPDVFIHHYHGASYAAQAESRRVLDGYYSARKYLREWFSPLHALCFSLTVRAGWHVNRALLTVLHAFCLSRAEKIARKKRLLGDLVRAGASPPRDET